MIVDLCMTTMYHGEEQVAVYIRNTVRSHGQIVISKHSPFPVF